VTKGRGSKPAFAALATWYTQPTHITVVFHDTWRNAAARPLAPPPSSTPRSVTDLPASTARLSHLRDGEVVLYRVSRSSRWQARVHVLSPKWIRFSTRQRNQIDAARVARERYDEAGHRERLGQAKQVRGG